MDFAELLLLLGNPGKYQTLLALLLWFCTPLVTVNHLLMGIIGTAPKHSCALPYGVSKSEALPVSTKDGSRVFSSCKIYENYNATAGRTVPCPNGWEFTYESGGTTIVSEWDLVCDKAYLVSLSTSLYFAGVMLGGPIFGMLSDKFGRRNVFFFNLYGHLILGVIVSQLKSFIAFVICRVIIGFMLQGMQTSAFIILLETISTPNRSKFGLVYIAFWGIGTLWLSVIAYVLRDWRSIQLAICLPSVITILYIWIVPESLRWLLVNEKREKLKTTIEKIANRNEIKLPEDTETLVNELKVVQMQEGLALTQILNSKILRKRLLIMCYIWISVSIGYYGLALNAGRLRGDKYVNFLINGATELPVVILCVWSLGRFGRKKPLLVFFVLAGISCIISGSIPDHNGKGINLDVVATVFASIGKLFAAAAFTVVILFSAELFPTGVRNTAMGYCTFSARFGGILCPQLLLLGDYTFDQLPILIFGGLLISGGIVELTLTETKDKILVDTVTELEGLNNNPEMNEN